MRTHFDSYRRQTGRVHPAWKPGPPFPEPLQYLWRWFLDVHRGRTTNGMAHTRATHQDVLAWQENFGIRAQPWELRAIMSLGAVWMNVMNEEVVKVSRPNG